MAEKHVVSFSSIYDFFKNHGSQLKRGENSYNSGNVVAFTYDASVEPPIIKGEVTASMKKRRYAVEMIFSKSKTITSMTCTCPRGQDICHHMAALALHLHYNVSATDSACQWNVKKDAKGKIQKMKDLYKLQPYAATCRQASQQEVDKFRSELLKSHVVGFSWLLRDEPCTDFLSKIVNIEQLVFSEEYLEATDKVQYFSEKCKVSLTEIIRIAQETTGQSANENWLIARKHRLTASKFNSVLDAVRRNSYPPSFFKNLLETYNLGRVRAVQWGKDNEKLALQTFETETGLKVVSTGLWLHESGFLGASPDGLVEGNSLLEIKCPYKLRDTQLDEGLKDPTYIIYYEDDQPIVNSNHSYYNQIQGQLYICKKDNCYLTIWTPRESRIFLIKKDEAWARNLEILKDFYLQKFLPYVCGVNN